MSVEIEKKKVEMNKFKKTEKNREIYMKEIHDICHSFS
jgi:hypothetical protein